MKTSKITLDEIIKDATCEVFDNLIKPIRESSKERERQEKQAHKSFKFHSANKGAKTEKNDSAKGDETVEADKEDLVPKEIVRQLKKSDDPPNISPEKMDVIFPSKEQVIRANVKNILIMLNMMRSGNSLKKTNIRRALLDYYNTLDAGEKQALYSILSGLTQIISANVTGKDAVDPSYVGLSIKAQQKQSDENPSQPAVKANSDNKKPEVIKKTKPEQSDEVPLDDKKAKDNLPIVVGEVANKSDIYKIFESLKK